MLDAKINLKTANVFKVILPEDEDVDVDEDALGVGGEQLDADAEGDDELVRGNGAEHVPNLGRSFLHADGDALKDAVEGEGQDGQDVAHVGQHRVAGAGGHVAVAASAAVTVTVAVTVAVGLRLLDVTLLHLK